MSAWLKIQTVDYYRAYENAGPREEKDHFQHGNPIDEKWEDGTITREKLILLLGESSAQIDMNNSPDIFPTRTFYADKTIHGTKVRVRLYAHEIRYVNAVAEVLPWVK